MKQKVRMKREKYKFLSMKLKQRFMQDSREKYTFRRESKREREQKMGGKSGREWEMLFLSHID